MFALAAYTIRETVRDQIYLGFFVVMLVLTSIFMIMGSTPWGLENLVLERLSWMVIDIILSVMTAIYAVNNIYRERDKKILFNHLTLPMSRVGYLAGKLLGLWLTITALALIGAVIVLIGDSTLTHLSSLGKIRWQVLWLAPSVGLKIAVLLGYAFFLSQFASNALTASLFTLGIYLVGNGSQEILGVAANIGGTAEQVATVFYYLVPNLQLLDLEQSALYGTGPSLSQLGAAIIYAFSYLALPFAFACVIFRRRDL